MRAHRPGPARVARQGRVLPVGALLAALLASCMGFARAHGDWAPLHGGVMNEGGETSFELVGGPQGTTFYVSDHGTPRRTAGSTGSVAVVRDGRAFARATAWPRGEDAMHTGALPLRPRDQVTLTLTWADGSTSIGRFSVPAGYRPAPPNARRCKVPPRCMPRRVA